MPDTVIKTSELTKLYGTVVGVRDLELEVERGEVFGFLGPNGAGKTTTLRLLMGLLRPSAGKADVFGLDAWKDSVAVKEKVGYLPGEAALYERMTGIGHIKFVANFNGNGEEEGFNLAERLELELERKVQTFSRGMKQKLAIILALMKNTPLIIMDEPTNALDPITQKLLYDILNERRNDGATILFSSHNLPEVERMADRVGIIRQGTLAGTERIEDMRAKRLRNVEVIFDGELPAGSSPSKMTSTLRRRLALMSSMRSVPASVPCLMMPTRSAIRSTSGRLCEEKRMVAPSLRRSFRMS